jgi:hypothetical protein
MHNSIGLLEEVLRQDDDSFYGGIFSDFSVSSDAVYQEEV